jgi:hypothetical protein
MPNRLDEYLQPSDESNPLLTPGGVPVSASGLPRVVIPTNKLETPTDPMTGYTPSAEGSQDLTGKLKVLADVLQRLTGTKFGEERSQLWPERMIRSAVSLPGDVASGAEPIIDPNTGRTSERVIERAQDTAGLMSGGAFGATKPGMATLGSGPVRTVLPIERESLNYLAAIKDPKTGKVHVGERGDGHAALVEDLPSHLYDHILENGISGFVDGNGKFIDYLTALERAKTLKSDGQGGAAVSAVTNSQKAPVFYSAVENAVNAARQPTAPGQQWLGFLKNQPGVKPEELHWSGVEDYLANAKGPVSKDDLIAHLGNNKLDLKDVTKGAVTDEQIKKVVNNKIEDEIYDFEQSNGRAPTSHEAVRLAQDLEHKIRQDPKEYIEDNANTKYESYQLPGGKNYREHLITLPSRNQAARDHFADNLRDHGMEEALRRRNEGPSSSSDYRSSHWEEPNVLAHVRTNERDVGGVPSHHIEEIQSDWHQQGRKQGYKIDDAQADRLLEKSGIKNKDDVTSEIVREAEKQGKLTDSEASALHTWAHPGPWGVPDAPFKTTWPELSMKRMIRQAVDEGKTRISWTPGETQAARYNLSKQINNIYYNPITKKLIAEGKNNRTVLDQRVEADKLSDVIGKEAADRLLNKPSRKEPLKGEDNGDWHILDSADLKVGGEGMKEFYDKMLPKMVEKLGKPYGVKVQKQKLDNEQFRIRPGNGGYDVMSSLERHPLDQFATRAEAEKFIEQKSKNFAHYFDIPPKMADAIKGKGFPLFAGGIPVIPVDYTPIFKKKDQDEDR